MNLYRAKFGLKRGAASWGDWRYYENTDSLKSDLLDAHLDVAMQRQRGAGYSIIRAWRDFLSINKEDKDFTYTNIFAVERVDNDEWVTVDYEFTAPEVHLT